MIEVSGSSVVFKNYPMSPSSNSLYASFRGRLIKSNEGRLYVKRVQAWAAPHQKTVLKLREILKDKTLRVDYSFFFPRSKLITKKNTIKKTDFTNYIKAAQDALSDLIGVDDSHFISGYFEKRISGNDESYVEITISVQELIR